MSDFATTDIETMDVKGKQIPVIITVCIPSFKGSEIKYFMINHNLLETNFDLALNELWTEYFNYMIKSGIRTVFVHNLGSFDGYFIYKHLSILASNFPESVQTIIDDHSKFISITLKLEDYELTWKDSYRIFPVSLKNLCKVFNVKGKTSDYNPEFNNLKLFHNPNLLKDFIAYAIQDSASLFSALNAAQGIYCRKYNVDICSILSTSSLSLKIFRQSFLKTEIPILKSLEDSFIRKGYFGGATDYYKGYGKNLYYYDVNSLYPFAMTNPMPHKISYFIRNMEGYDLNNFFGFALARITTPDNIVRPLLPYRTKNNRTIFPIGTWDGVYFSEELKAIKKLGYKIKLIKGYKFTKVDLFNKYVNHFYLGENRKNKIYNIFYF